MSKTYTVRFWNRAGENIKVGGKYMHDFDSFADAMESGNALCKAAWGAGAVEADINNEFYPIVDEEA